MAQHSHWLLPEWRAAVPLRLLESLSLLTHGGPLAPAAGSTCSMKWPTMQRTAGMQKWTAHMDGWSAQAWQTALPMTCE